MYPLITSATLEPTDMLNRLAGNEKGQAPGGPARLRPVGWIRWGICGLLLLATILGYIDRCTIAILKPYLSKSLNWNEIDYAHLIVCFQAGYAVGFIAMGWIIDRIGVRTGYLLAAAIWGCAQLMGGFASSLSSFGAMLFVLGLGQGGNFPAALRAVAEWFPQAERSLANGVFNAGTNIGIILTPIIVPAITLGLGWRFAFAITGTLTLLWVIAWLAFYRRPEEHKKVSAAELAYIASGRLAVAKSVMWSKLLRIKETWAYASAKFLSDSVWWFFMFWLPPYFAKTFGLELRNVAAPIIVIYLMSDTGSIVGGWLSFTLNKHGMSTNAARKLTMLIAALGVVPVALTPSMHGLWTIVGLMGLACASHQAFIANLHTFPSDVFPVNCVASVSGIGGCVGALGGLIFSWTVGNILQSTGSYALILMIAPLAYILAVVIIQTLSPRLEPAKTG